MLPGVVFGSIVGEDREELTPHHFAHLIPLGQCCLDYMLFQANATGAALVGSRLASQSLQLCPGWGLVCSDTVKGAWLLVT